MTVRATLTSLGRYYVSRAHIDGTVLRPYRFVLGSGWENPRWGAPMTPSSEVTDVINVIAQGNLADNRLTMEKANLTTLSIRLVGPLNPDAEIMEALVYAKIINSPIAMEIGAEIPFASSVFPSWFLATDQQVTLRMVLPL